MKGSNYFRLFCRLGIGFVLLLAITLHSRAQTGGPVGPPTLLISVVIVSPTNGQTFSPPADITISATSVDYGAYVHTMAFYNGTNELAFRIIDPIGPSQSNGTPVTVEYDWTNVPAGSYNLTVVASDTAGRAATSAPVNITVTGLVPPPIPTVTVVATDPTASMAPGDTGTFTVYRTGSTSNSLRVVYSLSGTASNGVDFATLSNSISIPAGAASAPITVTPIKDPFPDPSETVVLQLTLPPYDLPLETYHVGVPNSAVVTILGNTNTNALPPVVTIIATDPIAVEPGTNHIYFQPQTAFAKFCGGTNTATFLVRRVGPTSVGVTNSNLAVYYSIGGTASNGVDYATLPGYVTILAGHTYALITIVPLEDNDPSNSPPFSTVVLSLVPPPTATNVLPAYTLGWPAKAGAIILEERLFPGGPPIGPLPDTSFHVNIGATNGLNYCMQVSTNLIDWLPVCTNTVVKSSIQFVDPEAGSLPNRYYRSVPVAAVPAY